MSENKRFKPNRISNYEEFKQYVLRQLGEGVTSVNVSSEQVDQALSDAIQWFQEFCEEGHEELMLLHELKEEDFDNHYLDLPETVLGIKDVKYQGNFNNTTFLSDSFMVNSSMWFQYLHGYSSNLTDWYFTKLQLAEMKSLMQGFTPIRFNYSTGRLFIDDVLFKHVPILEGDTSKRYVLVVAHVAVDPDEYPRLYNNIFLKRYATALVLKLYATNISKYSGIKLPGGTELDGQRLYDRAVKELEDLQKEAEQYIGFPAPIVFGMMG